MSLQVHGLVTEEQVDGIVTARGSLRIESGKLYRDPEVAAQRVVSDPEAWYGWSSWVTTSGDSLGSLQWKARSESVRASAADSIDRLGLSARTTNALTESGMSRVGEVVGSFNSLDELPGIGQPMRSRFPPWHRTSHCRQGF